MTLNLGKDNNVARNNASNDNHLPYKLLDYGLWNPRIRAVKVFVRPQRHSLEHDFEKGLFVIAYITSNPGYHVRMCRSPLLHRVKQEWQYGHGHGQWCNRDLFRPCQHVNVQAMVCSEQECICNCIYSAILISGAVRCPIRYSAYSKIFLTLLIKKPFASQTPPPFLWYSFT